MKTQSSGKFPNVLDLHFHGAFGVDLASSKLTQDQFETLCRRLATKKVTGFCPTLLSLPPAQLLSQVSKLGGWIQQAQNASKSDKLQLATPHGLHLEGPFLNPRFKGAHPKGALIEFSRPLLKELWDQSRGTLSILTLAPELLSRSDLRWLITFSKRHKIRLQAGHSAATFDDARRAFDSGFTGVTHAWNAMAFHHRDPGLLGAAIDFPEVSLEIIPDGVHVHPSTAKLLMNSVGIDRTFWVSDAAPCAGLALKSCSSFGPYRVENRPTQNSQIAAFLADDSKKGESLLAGGALLLSELAERGSRRFGLSATDLKKVCWSNPMKALRR